MASICSALDCQWSWLDSTDDGEAMLPMKMEDGIGLSTAARYWSRHEGRMLKLFVSTGFFIKEVFLALLPSPLSRRLSSHRTKPRRLHATSYLDGLRGVASLVVCVYHFILDFIDPYADYYGVNAKDLPSSPIQLPFVRLIYAGRPAVHVFFVISGFVLSQKSLRLIRSQKYADLSTTLSSSIFRRGMRLFLPVIVSTFLGMLTIFHGFQGWRVKSGLFKDQLWDWVYVNIHLWKCIFDWDHTANQPYDSHLWTIPIEMCMSMLLFVVLLGLSRCKVPVRLLTMVVLMWFFLKCRHWAATEFLGGAMIAEYGLIQEDRAKRATTTTSRASDLPYTQTESQIDVLSEKAAAAAPTPQTWTNTLCKTFWWTQFLIALYIAGWPNRNVDKVAGLRVLNASSPEPYYSHRQGEWPELQSYPWFAMVAMQIVLGCQQLPTLQRLFNSEPIQHLADVSFALYLIHGPMQYSFGWYIMSPAWDSVGAHDAGTWGIFFVFWCGMLGVIYPCVWAADLFWRFVDVPSVRISKWVEKKCTVVQHR